MPAEHMAGGGGPRPAQRPHTPLPRAPRPAERPGAERVEIPVPRARERAFTMEEPQSHAAREALPVGPEPVPSARRWAPAAAASGGAERGRDRPPSPGRAVPLGGESAPSGASGAGGAGAGGGMLGERGASRPLDRIDRAILRLLQQDGRASIRSVAERVHVSRANAYARIARMMEDGVIRGFTARIDHERAGQGASAYVTLKIVQNSWRTVRGQLLELPGVEHIALVSGDFDVLMLVHTVDNRALRELVLNRIQSLPAVLSTHTLLVFDETDRIPVLPEL